MSGGIGRSAALGAAIAAMALAGSAQAATVSIESDPFTGTAAVYRAAPGEANDVTVTVGERATRFEETGAALDAGPGCVRFAPGEVSCARAGEVVVQLGDRDDAFALGAGSVEGARAFGGDGADALTGIAGASEALDGGPGDDVVFGGQDGAGAGACAIPLIDCLASGDELRGGPGRDRLAGAGSDDLLAGGPGDDALAGGQGRDDLFGGDVVYGDEPDGDRSGADAIDGGPGDDVTLAGLGADRVRASDRNGEQVDCGAGHDQLVADLRDEAAACEVVQRCGTSGAVASAPASALDCVRGIVEG
jgi:hypothetical protein